MDIEQRNKLAELVFEIKENITDNQYRQLMETIGGTQNYEHAKYVKLTYLECEYIDTVPSDGDDDHVFAHGRLRRVVETKIVQVYGGDEAAPEVIYMRRALNDCRMHVHELIAFKKRMPEGSDCHCHIQLLDTRWIHPLKITVIE